jgi:DNA-binding transcriptional LysR family regulator
MAGGAAFEKRFDARFGQVVQLNTPFSYDAVYIIVDAMKRANSIDPAKILAAMPASGEASGLRRLLERTFGREPAPLNIVAGVDSLPTLLAAAKSGEAATILPASAVAGHPSKARPTRLRLARANARARHCSPLPRGLRRPAVV